MVKHRRRDQKVCKIKKATKSLLVALNCTPFLLGDAFLSPPGYSPSFSGMPLLWVYDYISIPFTTFPSISLPFKRFCCYLLKFRRWRARSTPAERCGNGKGMNDLWQRSVPAPGQASSQTPHGGFPLFEPRTDGQCGARSFTGTDWDSLPLAKKPLGALLGKSLSCSFP